MKVQKLPEKYNKKTNSGKAPGNATQKKERSKLDESAIIQHDNAGAIWTAPGISEHDTRTADQEPPAAGDENLMTR